MNHDEPREPTIGGLYACRNENGSFGIWKVLAIDGDAVSVRKYSNKYDARPGRLDPSVLTTAIDLQALLGGDQSAFAVGHMPLARSGFWEMEPDLVQVEPVVEDELVGYRHWLAACEAEDAGERAPALPPPLPLAGGRVGAPSTLLPGRARAASAVPPPLPLIAPRAGGPPPLPPRPALR